MTRHIAMPALALSALLLAGCSGGGSSAALPCLDVDAGLAGRIAEGANDGVPITPTGKIGAVKAPSFKDAYLVAMEFTAPGLNKPEVGVWASTAIDGGSGVLSVLAVDGMASQFTHWPNQLNGEKLSATEPGADDARKCVK